MDTMVVNLVPTFGDPRRLGLQSFLLSMEGEMLLKSGGGAVGVYPRNRDI